MATTLNPEIREIINTVHYRAWLSMKTRINSKNEFANTVRVAADKAKAELCSC
ncbi:hypothetical protein J3L18_07250 [Mucilaginibacter gossypii]|uniref:hypothetical protein n=1 Tax=Mucilaginibacter gossypii TaxID=551996 RepID=UPI00167472E3|nr:MULTISPECIES: hypothetical protein [Mucilaginibacter]QTE38854.1 hypothetical protein J3L18_07250 [Mucilaginibacter gossypii]